MNKFSRSWQINDSVMDPTSRPSDRSVNSLSTDLQKSRPSFPVLLDPEAFVEEHRGRKPRLKPPLTSVGPAEGRSSPSMMALRPGRPRAAQEAWFCSVVPPAPGSAPSSELLSYYGVGTLTTCGNGGQTEPDLSPGLIPAADLSLQPEFSCFPNSGRRRDRFELSERFRVM